MSHLITQNLSAGHIALALAVSRWRRRFCVREALPRNGFLPFALFGCRFLALHRLCLFAIGTLFRRRSIAPFLLLFEFSPLLLLCMCGRRGNVVW